MTNKILNIMTECNPAVLIFTTGGDCNTQAYTTLSDALWAMTSRDLPVRFGRSVTPTAPQVFDHQFAPSLRLIVLLACFLISTAIIHCWQQLSSV